MGNYDRSILRHEFICSFIIPIRNIWNIHIIKIYCLDSTPIESIYCFLFFFSSCFHDSLFGNKWGNYIQSATKKEWKDLELIFNTKQIFSSFCITTEHLIPCYALVVAYGDACAVNETYTRASVKAKQLKEQHHLNRESGFESSKAVIWELFGEQVVQVHLDIERGNNVWSCGKCWNEKR